MVLVLLYSIGNSSKPGGIDIFYDTYSLHLATTRHKASDSSDHEIATSPAFVYRVQIGPELPFTSSLYTTIHMKMRFSRMSISMQIKLISI